MYITLEKLMPGMERLARAWHPLLRRSFVRYAAGKRQPGRHKRSFRAQTEPHWLLVPQWLMQKYGQGRTANRKFVWDVLRGQFYLFLAVKIQDDLFDGHVEDLSLVYVADHLLLSGREAFAPYFSQRSPFWPFLNMSLRRTVNAIIQWDDAQLHGFSSPALAKEMTSAGYAVCNAASFAVCLRLKKVALFEGLLRCTDELAFVGQLLDDLEDMEQDLRRGRSNYTLRFLLGASPGRRAEIVERLARAVLVDGTAGRFFEMVQQHLRRASRIAAALALPKMEEYIAEHQKSLESVDRLHHQMRVGLLFGKHI